MNTIYTKIEGVLIFEIRRFHDERGYFQELYREDRYREAGLPLFVQDNISFSNHGVLRGLHFQNPSSQGKLVSVLIGEIYDVAVDLRKGSPTFGKHVSVVLSSENHRQLYVPDGFAHGFVVTGESALVSYKVTSAYDPSAERTLLWSDPELEIDWQIASPIVNTKDSSGYTLSGMPEEVLFDFAVLQPL